MPLCFLFFGRPNLGRSQRLALLHGAAIFSASGSDSQFGRHRGDGSPVVGVHSSARSSSAHFTVSGAVLQSVAGAGSHGQMFERM
jgi:hypothetical protein